MKKLALILTILGFINVGAGGCLSDNRCEVTAKEIVCPGGVVIAAEVPSAAKCLTDGSEIVCDSGHVFTVSGDAGSDAGTDAGIDAGSDAGSDADAWFECNETPSGIQCANGETVTIQPDSSRGACRWQKQPGVGPRIFCENGSILRPDGVAESVECAWNDFFIECTDGTAVNFSVPPTSCQPVFKAAGGNYSVECGAERQEIAADDWCGWPSGELILTEENFAASTSCKYVYGNLIIRDLDVERVAWLALEHVNGKVLIEKNPRLDAFKAERLWGVSGTFSIRDNPNLTAATIEDIQFVGDIEITNNAALKGLRFPKLRKINGLAIGNNKALTSFSFSKTATVTGPILFMDNSKFPVCVGRQLLVQATSQAKGNAYVGGFLLAPNGGCN